ncbi:ATP-binding protein [Pectobacterium carotovorum]|uniref:ATP-binding protein n=1 Tax=Pectobacterium carotovorum TaxID=554 RepID=UPI0029D789A7|nr:ATP-binding protein [Pectobacterium carotovorum]MDX6916569.1 ATP-binding protein [Pectobacterium carotovorum]
MKHSKLNRELAYLMFRVTIYSTVVTMAFYYVFAWISFKYLGHNESEYNDLFVMTEEDWFLSFITILLSLAISVYTAIRFSKKILSPMYSLAETARDITRGKLSARAEVSNVEILEVAQLIADFNTMAEKLEVTSGEIKTWNAAIAHELRTPVTILRGRLQGLADGVFLPENELFINLLKQTDGLARLIEDLRTLSLADSGYLSLQQNTVDLKVEVEAITEIMRSSLSEKKISLVSRLDDLTLVCDAVRIRQALLAILDNTRRYTQPGLVMVSCFREQDNAIITIEDEGPGIPLLIRDSLFEPFRRGEDSRSRQHGGTGLGLAVVSAIIQAHKGNITLFTSSMGGAGFKISLPIN